MLFKMTRMKQEVLSSLIVFQSINQVRFPFLFNRQPALWLLQWRDNYMIPNTASKQIQSIPNPSQLGRGSRKHSPNYTPQIRNSPSQQRLPNSRVHPLAPHQRSQINDSRHSQYLAGTDRLVQLHERLKNIHHFYKTRIEEQKTRTAQRNQVFMNMAQQMQHSHTEKVEALQALIDETEGDRKQAGGVDDKMTEIKSSIDELLRQSSQLKTANQQLQRSIAEKEMSCRDKEQQVKQLRDDLMEARNQLESFERLNLKQNKRNREIVTMIDSIKQT